MSAHRGIGWGARMLLPLAVCTSIVTGCTTLKVTKLRDTDTTAPDGTIPYSLPQKSFLLTVTRVVKSCPAAPDGKKKVADGEVKIDSSVTVVPFSSPDPTQRYFIDYQEQRSIFKDTTFSVESHENSTLKSFNGTVNDQAGPIVVATVGTAIKIAAAATLLQTDSRLKPTCNPFTMAAFELAKSIEAKLAAKKQLDPADAAAYQKALEQLTIKQTITWTPSPKDAIELSGKRWGVRYTIPGISEAAKKKWLLLADGASSGELVAEISGDSHFLPTNESLQSGANADPKCDDKDCKGRPVCDGFVLRYPSSMLLRICRGDRCPDDADGEVVDDVLFASDEIVPQFGQVVLLPLHNRIFENSNLVVNMSPDGVVTKTSVQSLSTAAAGIEGVGKDADLLKTSITEQRKAKNDARTAEKNETHDENKRLAECLESQKKIRDAGGVPIGVCM